MNKTQILKILSKLYPEVQSELDFDNEYQLIVAVTLSAQCTDKKVNQVTPDLFKQYPNFAALSRGRISSIEKIIRPINYYKSKAKNLKGMATIVHQEWDDHLKTTFEELESLPGVGHKTASVVLGEKGIPSLPVDTHVFRVSKRLGFADGKDVKAVEEELKSQFPKKDWRNLHHRLIFHGRRVCKAQNPKCTECLLAEYCRERLSNA